MVWIAPPGCVIVGVGVGLTIGGSVTTIVVGVGDNVGEAET